MAVTDKVGFLCLLFISLIDLGTCQPEGSDGNPQPELFIFHESCALKKDEGPCKAIHDRFYFDIDTGHCKPFEYGGCMGNANNFHSLEACEEMCVVSANKSPCHLEEAPGPCRGLVTRYFYDSKSQTCKRFYYGGCFGNANNFRTMKDCEKRCQNPGNTTDTPQTEAPTLVITSKPTVQPLIVDEFTPPEFCFSPPEKGTCDRVDRRFHYNPKTKRCQAFHYSGCGGNKNNFVHRRHCFKMCMDGKRPKDTGKGGKIIGIKKKTNNILFRSI